MSNSTEIKKANRKALRIFIPVMVVSLIIGGVVGFFSADLDADALMAGMNAFGEVFGMYIAPCLMVAIAIILPVFSTVLFKKAAKLLSTWDGEDDEVPDAVDKNLSRVIWISNAAFIISFSLFAVSCSVENAIFDNNKSIIMYFISIAALLAILIETIVIQQKCVDASKKINPEKTASIYDMKFRKKWIDSCDEAEKVMIGKCAYKAFNATNILCPLLAAALTICSLTFDIGFLPTFVVCVIWFVNQSVYCKESIKYSKSGIKII